LVPSFGTGLGQTGTGLGQTGTPKVTKWQSGTGQVPKWHPYIEPTPPTPTNTPQTHGGERNKKEGGKMGRVRGRWRWVEDRREVEVFKGFTRVF
jgi:hypothetical protein